MIFVMYVTSKGSSELIMRIFRYCESTRCTTNQDDWLALLRLLCNDGFAMHLETASHHL